MTRGNVGVGLICLVIGLCATHGNASATGIAIGYGAAGTTPAVSITSKGAAAIVWGQSRGLGRPYGKLVARSIYPAGKLGDLQRITPVGHTAYAATEPLMFAGSSGHLVVAWHKLFGPGQGLYLRTRDPSGRLGPVTRIGRGVGNLDAAIDASGQATLVWDVEGRAPGIYLARLNSTGILSAPVRLDHGYSGEFPHVAIDAAGDAVAMWTGYLTEQDDNSRPRLYARKVVTSDGALGETLELARASNGHIAIGRQGQAVFLWTTRDERWNQDDPEGRIQVRFLTSRGDLTPILSLTGYRDLIRIEPRVTLLDDGTAVAVWASATSGRAVEARTFTPMSIGPMRSLAGRRDRLSGVLDLASAGSRAVAVWTFGPEPRDRGGALRGPTGIRARTIGRTGVGALHTPLIASRPKTSWLNAGSVAANDRGVWAVAIKRGPTRLGGRPQIVLDIRGRMTKQ